MITSGQAPDSLALLASQSPKGRVYYTEFVATVREQKTYFEFSMIGK